MVFLISSREVNAVDTRGRILGLIRKLDPDLQEVVAEVISLERENLDWQKPHGVKDKIRDIIDKHAKHKLSQDQASQ